MVNKTNDKGAGTIERSGMGKYTANTKSALHAIIIPGLLFGIIIWAVQFASDQCLIQSGFMSMRSTLFPIMALVVTPLLLVITGIVSEIIGNKMGDSGRTRSVPYAAGFLAIGLAFLLFRIVSSMNQYHPTMAPGILPRFSYVTGNLIMYLPILLTICTLFAFFSFAGGFWMHRVLIKKRSRPVPHRRMNEKTGS
jgi:hypothetical protein